MEPIAFAPVGPADTAALQDLFSRVRGHDLGAAAWPDALRDTALLIQFEAQRRGYAERWPSATTQFLMHDGDRAGWVILDRSGRAIHVVDIAVLPEMRGRGLGTAVLRALMDEGARDGRAITLSVMRSNMPAIRLYSRLGFQPTGADDLDLYLEWRPSAPPAAAALPFTAELFRGAIDTWFEVVQDGPPLLLPLRKVVESTSSGGFARFSLLFHGPGDRLLPQGLYTLRHPLVGDQDLFLVPVIGSNAERVIYEACFSVPERARTP